MQIVPSYQGHVCVCVVYRCHGATKLPISDVSFAVETVEPCMCGMFSRRGFQKSVAVLPPTAMSQSTFQMFILLDGGGVTAVSTFAFHMGSSAFHSNPT